MGNDHRRFHAGRCRTDSPRAGVDNVEVIDVGLEDLFKDIVKGQRGIDDRGDEDVVVREYRRTRGILLFGGVLLAAPYLACLAGYFGNEWSFSEAVDQRRL